jgi:hypothetical protein
MQTLDVGELATITTTWYDTLGQPAEPSAITLDLIKPDGTTVVLTKADASGSSSLVPPGTLDTWVFTYIVDQAGLWRYDVSGIVNGAPVEQPSAAFLVGVVQRTGPCEPWTTWEDVAACGGSSIAQLNAVQRENAIDQASELLWNLSGRVYPGVCETTRGLCLSCLYCYPLWCTCEPWNAIDLGRRMPVLAVWDVTVNGVVLAPTAYKLVDRRYLVRTDGQIWPRYIDMADPNLMHATWAYGRAIPGAGRKAAAVLASELAKACAGDSSCALPQRVTQVAREGTTYIVLDPQSYVKDGFTGLFSVDYWLEADRRGRKPRARIFAPGAPRTRMAKP